MRNKFVYAFSILILLCGVLALPVPAEAGGISYLQQVASGTDASSYTFSSQSLGTAAADRYIVVVVNARTLAGTALSSITVAGVTATLGVNYTRAGSAQIAAIGVAAVPTGTTGDIVLNFNGTMRRAGYGAYRVTGLSSATANDTATDDSDPADFLLDIPAGGFGVGVCGDATTGGATYTWTGLDEDFDAVLEAANANYTGAHKVYAAAQTNLAIQCAHSETGAVPASAVASYGLNADASSIESDFIIFE